MIVAPTEKGEGGGAGFDAMWNTEFQHRLVNDHGNPSILQEAARGEQHPDRQVEGTVDLAPGSLSVFRRIV